MKITIHVANIDHRHGTTQFANQSEDDLRYEVDCYCRRWAEKEGVTLTDDMTTSEVIEAYFAKVEDEVLQFHEHEVDIRLPSGSASLRSVAAQAVVNWLVEEAGVPDEPAMAHPIVAAILRNAPLPTERTALPAHLSQLPWKYVRREGGVIGSTDWIEDANGNIVVEHVGHIDGPFIAACANEASSPVETALRYSYAAISSLLEQVGQMRGMFPDEDGAIQQAVDDGDAAVEDIRAALEHLGASDDPPAKWTHGGG